MNTWRGIWGYLQLSRYMSQVSGGVKHDAAKEKKRKYAGGFSKDNRFKIKNKNKK